jgi:nucleotide-binding universal stress UspA family protein
VYDDILLPTDGTADSAAARHAADLAERYGATVHVLSVADSRNRFESPSSGLSGDAWREVEGERAESALSEAVAGLPEDLDVRTVVAEGVPTRAILEYVPDGGIDLVVMGTHGRTGIDRLLLSSTAERIVRRSPVPVLTVRLDGG